MTAAEEPPNLPPHDDVIDRVQWKALREAAFLGRLQPEGDKLLQRIHERHPEWLEEWWL